MSDFARQSERLAAIAAIGQGQLSQISILFKENEEFDEWRRNFKEDFNRLSGIVSSMGQNQRLSVKSVKEVRPPADDARVADLRETVTALVNQFNNLIKENRTA